MNEAATRAELIDPKAKGMYIDIKLHKASKSRQNI